MWCWVDFHDSLLLGRGGALREYRNLSLLHFYIAVYCFTLVYKCIEIQNMWSRHKKEKNILEGLKKLGIKLNKELSRKKLQQILKKIILRTLHLILLNNMFSLFFSMTFQPDQTKGSGPVPPGNSPFPCLLHGPGHVKFTNFPNHIYSQKEDLRLPWGAVVSFYQCTQVVQVESMSEGPRGKKQKENSVPHLTPRVKSLC